MATLSFFSGFVLCAALLALIVFASLRRQWLAAISAALGLLTLVISAAFGQKIGPEFDHLVDQVRFTIGESYYRRLVEHAPISDDGSKRVVVNWGGGGIVTLSFEYQLVYDPTRQIAEPDIGKSRCSQTARHLRDHFYSVSIICQ